MKKAIKLLPVLPIAFLLACNGNDETAAPIVEEIAIPTPIVVEQVTPDVVVQEPTANEEPVEVAIEGVAEEPVGEAEVELSLFDGVVENGMGWLERYEAAAPILQEFCETEVVSLVEEFEAHGVTGFVYEFGESDIDIGSIGDTVIQPVYCLIYRESDRRLRDGYDRWQVSYLANHLSVESAIILNPENPINFLKEQAGVALAGKLTPRELRLIRPTEEEPTGP